MAESATKTTTGSVMWNLESVVPVLNVARVDGDGAITWAELRGRKLDVERYAFAHLVLYDATGGARTPCPIRADQLLVDEHVDGSYAVMRFTATCTEAPAQVTVRVR